MFLSKAILLILPAIAFAQQISDSGASREITSYDCAKDVGKWNDCMNTAGLGFDCSNSDLKCLCDKTGAIYGTCYAAEYYNLDDQKCVDFLLEVRQRFQESNSMCNFSEDQLPGRGLDGVSTSSGSPSATTRS